VIANTFFPPNQPTAKRCFQLGEMLRRAVDDWKSDARIAVVGSGGMSHFCIDEELDQRFLAAINARDRDALCAMEQILLQSGSSELRNWIIAAGMLFDTGLAGEVIDYVPCYRSQAGTGTANGFICWN
jgi:OH-DDVA oxygenase/3-O-methylgallate 3,4-dioxygenase